MEYKDCKHCQFLCENVATYEWMCGIMELPIIDIDECPHQNNQ